MAEEIDWQPPNEFPDEVSSSNPRFSVDVLVYNLKTDDRTVAWYDYKDMRWLFLSNENIGRQWCWRYFKDEFDKPKKQKNGGNNTDRSIKPKGGKA